MSSTPSARRSTGLALARGGVMGVATAVALQFSSDPDLWGHLRYGLDWLSTFSVHTTDVYSFTSDRPWINHEWLAEALYAFTYRLGGTIALAILNAAIVLAALRVVDHEQAIRRMPWGPILMLSGVSVLVALLDKTGGLDLFTELLARLASPGSLTGVIAFVTGLISVYSSSSGVVLPAFIPTIPGLIQKIGGGDAMAIASSVNVGAHLVDVSPLSTLGALCIANAALTEDRKALFNKLMIWGLSMSVIGAFVCWVFFGLL